jgi:dephospho-CoA kinase
VQALKAKGNFTLFSVDTDRQLRYERILLRGSVTDHVSFEIFSANEDREMQSTDPNKQNLSACMAQANYHFLNNGSFADLYQQIDSVIRKF